jgi:hypothetical protein
MMRVLAITFAACLGAALLPHGSVPAEAEVKSKAKGAPGVAREARTSSAKRSRGQENKKPKSLYFPEEMLGRKKAHPDFLWSPK